MYKAAVRWMIRRNIAALNAGNYQPVLRMYAADATLTFPGDNSWSRMYREPDPGRAPSPTHRGRAEIEAFLQRYVGNGIQMEVEDILVNGPPWNTRVAVVVHDWVADPNGGDEYANRRSCSSAPAGARLVPMRTSRTPNAPRRSTRIRRPEQSRAAR